MYLKFLLALTLLGLVTSQDTLSADLIEAISEAEEELSDGELISSEDLYEDVSALEAVYDLMVSEDVDSVTILGVEYSQETLEELIDATEEDAEDQAAIEEAVAEAEAVFDDGDSEDPTSEQFEEYAAELEVVLEVMDEDDSAVIDGVAYDEAGVEDLVVEATEDAEDAAFVEALIEESNELLEEELTLEISAAWSEETLTDEEEVDLAADIEALIDLLDEDESVEIDGVVYDAEDLQVELDGLLEEIESDQEIADAESVLEDDEVATSEDLEDYVEELEDLTITEPIVLDGVTINDQDDLEEYIEDLEAEIEVLKAEEELLEEIGEAEDVISDGEVPDSEDYFDLAEQLQDVLDLMDAEDTVEIDGVEYSYDELKQYISDTYNLAEETEHIEELDLAVEEAEDALGDGNTSAQYLAYAAELEDLLEVMTADDVVTINGEDYTEEEVEQEIIDAEATAEELVKVETISEAVLEVETALATGIDTSDETEALIQAYEDLIAALEEQDLTETEINGDTVTIEMMEDEINELVELTVEQVAQEELDAAAQEIEDYVDQYVDEDGTVYITADQLEGELELWEDLQSILDEDESVEVDGFEYTSENIDDFIAVVESTVEYLDDNDLVQVVIDGTISYMDEEEYFAQEELEEEIEEVEAILNEDDIDSTDLEEMI